MKIWIKAKQLVEYYQQVNVTKEQYLKLKDYDYWDVDNSDPNYELLDSLIDKTDIFDSDLEFKDVEIIKSK